MFTSRQRRKSLKRQEGNKRFMGAIGILGRLLD
jgi:hypothetical protein